MSGNCLSCRKGVKDPFEVQDGRCNFSRDATVEKGLISLGWENLLDFLEPLQVPLELQQGPQEPARVASEKASLHASLEDLSGFLSSQYRVLRPHVESRPESEDCSPVLTWIVGFLWSFHRGFRPRLEWRHAHPLSF